jgi:hypothetical protein
MRLDMKREPILSEPRDYFLVSAGLIHKKIMLSTKMPTSNPIVLTFKGVHYIDCGLDLQNATLFECCVEERNQFLGRICGDRDCPGGSLFALVTPLRTNFILADLLKTTP